MPSSAPWSAAVSRRRVLSTAALTGLGALGVGLVDASAAAAAPAPSAAAAPPADFPAWSPFQVPAGLPSGSMYPDMVDALDFNVLAAYGAAGYGGSEVGEVSTVVDAVLAAGVAAPDTPLYDAWVDAFLAMADRVSARARTAAAAGHVATARANHLRASTYYGQALFFVLGTSDPSRETAVYRSGRDAFAAAAALMEPVFAPVQIPYDGPGGPIPGFFAAAPGDGPRPTVIITNGSDGQLCDVYVQGAAAAIERGLNVLIYEGPGQGAMLFERDVPFRPDWEAVVTPIVDFLVARPDVDPDRIALYGVSFGGGLVLRAAAHEPRLRAVVADPASITPSAPFSSLAGVRNVDFQGYADGLSATDRAIFTAGLNKRAEIFGKRYRDDALQGRLLDITGLYATVETFDLDAATLAGVTVPALAVDYQFEQFFPRQTEQAYAELTRSPHKQYVRLTEADGAQLHDAPMAPQFHNEVYLDWLLDRFAEPRPPVPPTTPGHTGQSGGTTELANTGTRDAGALAATGAALAVAGAATLAAARVSPTPRRG